jgi:hypothetical protein
VAKDLIGTVQFSLVERPQHAYALRAAVTVEQRDGIDGHEATGIGDRGEPFVWDGCFQWLATIEQAYSFIATVEALKGTIVQISDTWEVDHENILVRSVGQIGVPRLVLRNGSNQYQVVCRIEMQRIL